MINRLIELDSDLNRMCPFPLIIHTLLLRTIVFMQTPFFDKKKNSKSLSCWQMLSDQLKWKSSHLILLRTSQSMPWLADLVESSEGSLDVLPVQCLCEFLLHDVSTEISSSSAPLFNATRPNESPQSSKHVKKLKKQVRAISCKYGWTPFYIVTR